MMKKDLRFSRRAVLRGLGASTVMLPLLQSERSSAQSANFPKRLVCVTMTNGNDPDDFHRFHAGGSETLAPLEPWRDQVITLRGVGYRVMADNGGEYGGHSSFPTILTGSYDDGGASNASIDQVVSAHIAQTAQLARPFLNLGVRSERGGPSTSWRSGGDANTNETDSERLFASLFSSAVMPEEEINALYLKRKSVLDFLGRDLEAFGRRMGTEDREKIEAHLTSIRALEVELEASATPRDCGAPVVDTDDYVPARMDAMFRMAAVALRCDFTRVITIDLYDNGGGNGNTFPWIDVNRDYHELAHAGEDAYQDKRKIDSWLFEQVAVLVGELAGSVEGTGSALDNSVILVSNDMDTGSNHYTGRINYALIGGAGGYLNTGRHYEVDEVPHNRLLTTVGNAMGLQIDNFGDGNYGGDLAEILA